MTSFEPEPDLDRALREFARNADRKPIAADDVWALAAGELPPAAADRVANEVLSSREAAAELGYASHILDDRTAIDREAATRSAERVLAIVREESPTLPRLRWRILGPALLAAAALLFVIAYSWRSDQLRMTWAVASVEPDSDRSGSGSGNVVTGFLFRVQLDADSPAHVFVFSLARGDAGINVGRLFPPHPRGIAAPSSPLRAWPTNPMATGRTTLPPIGTPPFAVPIIATAPDAVSLVGGRAAPTSEDAIEQALATVRKLVGASTTPADLAALALPVLEESGWTVQSLAVRL